MAFDKSKPFGEAHGEGVTHKFVQDGKLYNEKHEEVDAKGKRVAQPKAPQVEIKPKTEVDPQVAAQLNS